MKSTEERFWSFVKKTNSCWFWEGYKDKDGYGQFGISRNVKKRAHRFSYELLTGKISKKNQLDHLCRNRSCVNPEHLEPVSSKENSNRGSTGIINRIKTHCKNRHEYSGENLGFRKDRFGRICKICSSKSAKKHKNKIKMELM